MNGGQARVGDAGGATFADFAISFAGTNATISKLVLNVNTPNGGGPPETATIRFEFDYFGSAVSKFSGPFDIANGQNFFTIVSGLEPIDTIVVHSLSPLTPVAALVRRTRFRRRRLSPSWVLHSSCSASDASAAPDRSA